MDGLARILPTFGAVGGKPATHHPLTSASTEEGHKKALTDAEERGFQRGMEAAREEHDAKLAEIEAQFERRLREERERWTEEESHRLADLLGDAYGALETRLADSAGGVLLPLLDSMLAAKAVAELSETVRTLARQDRQQLVRISGREDLLQALRQRLDDLAGAIEFSPSDVPDVKITCGDAVIESELAAWAKKLSEAIGEARHG